MRNRNSYSSLVFKKRKRKKESSSYKSRCIIIVHFINTTHTHTLRKNSYKLKPCTCFRNRSLRAPTCPAHYSVQCEDQFEGNSCEQNMKFLLLEKHIRKKKLSCQIILTKQNFINLYYCRQGMLFLIITVLSPHLASTIGLMA